MQVAFYCFIYYLCYFAEKSTQYVLHIRHYILKYILDCMIQYRPRVAQCAMNDQYESIQYE